MVAPSTRYGAVGVRVVGYLLLDLRRKRCRDIIPSQEVISSYRGPEVVVRS